jgi:hypothetical protein
MIKLTDIYNTIKEETGKDFNWEKVRDIMKRHIDPKIKKSTPPPAVRPNTITKVKEFKRMQELAGVVNETKLTPLQQYLYNYEVEVSNNPEQFLEDIKKINNVRDAYDYYATERGWLVDKDLKQELKNLIMNLKNQNFK